MVKKKIKIAIFGCGNFGNKHLDNLLKMEGIEIVALYNRGKDNLEKTGKKVPKARMYQDYKDVFLKEKMDAALICVTPDFHDDIEKLCIKKKVHMFCEKPLCLSSAMADELAEEIKFADLITSVDYQERYSPALTIVKEIVAKEPVGYVDGYWIGGLPSASWWRKKELSGGQVVEQTTHIADMFRYIFGEVDSVYGSGRRDERFGGEEHDVEDYSTSVINFKSGMVANMTSCCYSKSVEKMGFEFFTPNFKVEYQWGKEVRIISGDKTEIINITQDNHWVSLKTFIEAVKSGERYEIRSPYEDSAESLKITLAINESIEKGQVVKISN